MQEYRCNFGGRRGFKGSTIIGLPVPSSPLSFNHFTPRRPDFHRAEHSAGSGKAGAARYRPLAWLFLAITVVGLVIPLVAATTYTVGGGAPTTQITFLFQSAYYRNGFNNIGVTPTGNVSKIGTAGLQQLFATPQSTAAVPVNVALIMPNQDAVASNTSVLQVLADIYGYYNSLGAGTVGLPTLDTQVCPGGAPAACTYQFFANTNTTTKVTTNYALFAYSKALVNGQNFFIKDPEYSAWIALGGLTGAVGFPIDASINVTSSAGTTATQQLFTGGAFFGTTSGTNNGQFNAVAGAIYSVYSANQGVTGFLGLPTSAELILPSGVHQQNFEGGSIQYTPGSTPVVLYPVGSVRVLGPGNLTTALQLNLNDTAQLTSQVFTPSGAMVTGRAVTWSSTNLNVLTVTPNAAGAAIKAVGGGTASVTATVNGVSSPSLQVTVKAPCCQIGDGAPSTVQQAFLDALSRNLLKVSVPVATGAQRAGAGYIQVVTPTGSAQPLLLAKTDSSPLAFIVNGAVLTFYQAAGGASSGLGYPLSDPTPGGRQMFEGGIAIAGNPAFSVGGAMLSKWSTLGYETGAAGSPTGMSSGFTTALGVTGIEQPFQAGTIFGISSGPHKGETYLVSGLILGQYIALGGPGGLYGAPLSDELAAGSTRRQAFENGYLDYTPGDAAAVAHPNPRTPAISAFPPKVVPGGRLKLAVTGFADNATVKVSLTNQPDFTVTLQNGIFAWDYVVPPSSTVGVISIHAVDIAGGATADGSFTIQTAGNLGARLVAVQGDGQSAGPSAILPQPLQVAIRDSSGSPLPNVPVTFIASPGATLSAGSVLTGSDGTASVTLRLPSLTGIAEVTAQALGQYVTFAARTITVAPLNVPGMTAVSPNLLGNGPAKISQKGAFLTATAMLLRYYQNSGAISSPNGLADPDTLNKYLLNCGPGCDGFVTNPDTGEQVVNLFRLSGFSGGLTDISVEDSNLGSIQSLVADGSPVLLLVSLAANGAPVGGTALVATGVAADGSIILADPNPVLARTSLNDYLNGFSAAGATWRGTILSAVRVVIKRPASTAYVVAAVSQPTNDGGVTLDVESPRGACGRLLEVPDAAIIGATALATPRSSRFIYCSGADPAYQVNVGASGAYRAFVEGAGLTQDLSGTAPAAYTATLNNGTLSIAPQTTAFTASGVLNAATFSPGIAPGGLFSLFGSGLYGAAADTTVTFGRSPSQLILKNPFQINGQVPADLAPGEYAVTIHSASGISTQQVPVSAVAPGIFVVSGGAGGRVIGAVINQDGTLNDVGTPAHRGDVLTVYCTGLGAVVPQGNLSVTVTPATALVNSAELQVQYAGLTSGFIGLYQVNVPLPAGMAPGSSVSLAVKIGGVVSNAVSVAIE